MSCLEEPGRVAGRPRERPLGIAEELGLHQRLGDRGAVEGHEGLVAALARPVDRLREHLLAGAARPADEHTGPAVRHQPRLAEQLLHHRTAGHQLPPPLLSLVAGDHLLAGAAADPDRPLHLLDHLAPVEGLGEEGEHPAAGGRDRVRDGPVGRQHQNGQRRSALVDRLEELQPVHAFHAQVGQHRLRPVHLEPGEGFRPARRGDRLEAGGLQPQFQQLQDVRVVIDQENFAFLRAHGGGARGSWGTPRARQAPAWRAARRGAIPGCSRSCAAPPAGADARRLPSAPG